MPYLRRLSAAAIGEDRARLVFEEGKPSALTRLEHAPADALVALLVDEPVQIIGAILSRISPPTAAAVIAALPADRQAAVVAHVGRMTEVPASVLEDMAAAVAAALPSDEAATTISVDGVSRAAEILKATGKDTSLAILGALQEADSGLADDVRQAMFTFEDLVRLDARAMRELLREVSTERLVIALKGAPETVLTAVLAGLSSRAATLIRDDLEALPPVKRAEVERARTELVQAALRLEAEGKIVIGGEGDE
jgi:flagellar motor switch protein FliG